MTRFDGKENVPSVTTYGVTKQEKWPGITRLAKLLGQLSGTANYSPVEAELRERLETLLEDADAVAEEGSRLRNQVRKWQK